MNDIESRLKLAKFDKHALDSLLFDYMPFVKKQVLAANLSLEFDDMLSIAMLTFSGCVTQYDTSKGTFMAFAATSIKNRLIDEARREGRYTGKVLPLFNDDGGIVSLVEDVSLQEYNIESQRQTLADEIDALSAELLPFGITFRELPKICPKQDRSRTLCFELAKMLLANDKMKSQLFSDRKLAQAELAKQLDISAKTIEKHRRYIVTLAVLLSGDYPHMKAFLPKYKEVR